MIKTFVKDRLIRDSKGKPIGRVIMASDYKEGEDIEVSLLEAPIDFLKAIKGYVVYVDGNPYRIPKDLPNIRITRNAIKWVINTFVLEKV